MKLVKCDFSSPVSPLTSQWNTQAITSNPLKYTWYKTMHTHISTSDTYIHTVFDKNATFNLLDSK